MNYTDNVIDNDFLLLADRKLLDIVDNNELIFDRRADLKTIVDISHFINDLKPKSKYRKMKRDILIFLDIILESRSMSRKEYIKLSNEYLSYILIFLSKEHNFFEKGSWFIYGILYFAFDIILWIVGFGSYYYYAPLLTLIYAVKYHIKLNNAKKENRCISF